MLDSLVREKTMVDENSEPRPTSVDEAKEAATPLSVAENTDWFLAELVRWSNQHGIEIGVTLSIGGAVVTGIMIGGAEYFETFSAAFQSGLPDDSDRASFGDVFSALAQRVYGPVEEPAPGATHPLPSFIHLRAARFVRENGQFAPTEGALWRGKIRAVDGFSLGEWRADVGVTTRG